MGRILRRRLVIAIPFHKRRELYVLIVQLRAELFKFDWSKPRSVILSQLSAGQIELSESAPWGTGRTRPVRAAEDAGRGGCLCAPCGR